MADQHLQITLALNSTHAESSTRNSLKAASSRALPPTEYSEPQNSYRFSSRGRPVFQNIRKAIQHDPPSRTHRPRHQESSTQQRRRQRFPRPRRHGDQNSPPSTAAATAAKAVALPPPPRHPAHPPRFHALASSQLLREPVALRKCSPDAAAAEGTAARVARASISPPRPRPPSLLSCALDFLPAATATQQPRLSTRGPQMNEKSAWLHAQQLRACSAARLSGATSGRGPHST
eukprot:CAMPEP_0184736514 /NCGR_PEP_ID=MMETSP0314-20130426/62441_1 /TAXON_ID=38298 /ORGANISM="Rhodella maculata, Strain CCMP 736" /LENGTH=232 /DNA_ID=CAMNT_0027203575 /DNA_START=93 /DNA_END=789 /DNA_ORIENTATION=+